jgi:hypothetical protein
MPGSGTGVPPLVLPDVPPEVEVVVELPEVDPPVVDDDDVVELLVPPEVDEEVEVEELPPQDDEWPQPQLWTCEPPQLEPPQLPQSHQVAEAGAAMVMAPRATAERTVLRSMRTPFFVMRMVKQVIG